MGRKYHIWPPDVIQNDIFSDSELYYGIREDTLDALDKIAAETNRSRNELINIILRHGVQNLEIE